MLGENGKVHNLILKDFATKYSAAQDATSVSYRYFGTEPTFGTIENVICSGDVRISNSGVDAVVGGITR